MVYLSNEVKALCQDASVSELEAIRAQYRHVLRRIDLKWIDRLLERRLGGRVPLAKAIDDALGESSDRATNTLSTGEAVKLPPPPENT